MVQYDYSFLYCKNEQQDGIHLATEILYGCMVIILISFDALINIKDPQSKILLKKYCFLQQWCYDENEDWDGNPQSYDIVVLLTGKKLMDVPGITF